jgi:integrase
MTEPTPPPVLRLELPGVVSWSRPRWVRGGVRYPAAYAQDRDAWSLLVAQAVRDARWRPPPEARYRVAVGVAGGGKRDLDRVCTAALDALRRRVATGLLGDPAVERATLGAFLRAWLEGKRGTVEDTTWARYEQNVRLHLVPALGRLRVAGLRPDDLRTLYAAKVRTGLAPKTVRDVHLTLSQALKQGVRDGDPPRNVAEGVKPPKVERREMSVLSPPEVERLLATARAAGERARKGRDAGHAACVEAFVTLAVYTGLREGELLGLKRPDIAWDTGTLTVQRNPTRGRGRAPTLRDPKTPAGLHTLHLAPTALATLRAHRARQNAVRLVLGPDYDDRGLVFAAYTGAPLLARNVIRAFKALLPGAGLPREARVHDLRHTTATTLIARGTDVATTARILGHATPQVTAVVYAHVLPRATAEAAERLEAAFRSGDGAAAGG